MLYMINVMNPQEFFQRTNWYVWELLMLYFVFYMNIKIHKDWKNIHFVILLYSIIFVCIAYVFKFENPWYGSTLCFWLGISYFIYKDKFKDLIVLNNPMVKIIYYSVAMMASVYLFTVRGGGGQADC